MPQCKAKKADGEQCGGVARKGDRYCPYHRKKYGRGITHGSAASPEMLGIPKHKRLTFKEFMALKDPFGLQTELAQLRTLLVEHRESMSKHRPDYVDAFIEDVSTRGAALLNAKLEGKVSPETTGKLLKLLGPVLKEVYQSYVGEISDLTTDEMQALAGLVKDIAYTAEKAKKIADGITISVDIKAEMLTNFIREFILPNVPDHNTRVRIIEAASAYRLSHRATNPLSLPASAVEAVLEQDEVDAEVVALEGAD